MKILIIIFLPIFTFCSCTTRSSSKFSGKTKPALSAEIFLTENETISRPFEKLGPIEAIV